MLSSIEINEIFEHIKTEPSEAYESEVVEFKEYKNIGAFHNKSQEVATELSAFANKSGGVLIVGIKDSSNVSNNNWQSQLVGFEEADCLEVKKRVQGNLEPAINLDVCNHSFEGNNFLLIRVVKSNDSLVMTAGGKCFMRSGRDSSPMTPQEVTGHVKSLRGYDWSSEILASTNVSEALDDDQIEEAMNEYHSLKDMGEAKLPQDHFLESIGVTINGELTKGGLLFLGRAEVIRSIIGNIEYRFSKLEKGGFLPINEVWSGSLWEATTKIGAFLKQVIKYDEFEYDGKVYPFPNVCQVAFDEAMINSLVHRDYTLEGMTIIEFDNCSVTFTNPGTFYDGVTSENIFVHPPRHRNKALAQILMSFELVDRAGAGTKRMNIESLRLGRAGPQFSSANDCISASLELNSVKEGVFVVASPYEDYDVAELFLINLLYGKGYQEITSALRKTSVVAKKPWEEMKRALQRMSFLSLVGNKDGVYIVVNNSHRKMLSAYRKIKTYKSSSDYVSIFCYLLNNGEACSNELCDALNIASLAKTQRLLRDAKFIEKVENGNDTTWRLVCTGLVTV